MRISDWSSYVCSSDLGFDDDRRRKVPVDRQDGLFGNIVQPHLLRRRSQFDELFVAQTLSRFMAEKREFQRNVRWLLVQLPSGWRTRLLQIGRASCRERGCTYV